MAVQLATDEDFSSIVEAQDKVVVKYYADWCGSCKLFAPKYKRLSGDERFAWITFLEVNAETNPEARKAGGVDNLPYIATFHHGTMLKGDATSKEEYVVELLQELNGK